MATQWQNRYVELSNVNSGNELQNGDDILAEHMNVALENGAYAKGRTDTLENDLTNLTTRVTSLEGKKLYFHNITMTGTNLSAIGGVPSGWNYYSFQIKFQIISPSNLDFNIFTRVRSRCVLGVDLTATGYILLVDNPVNPTAGIEGIVTSMSISGLVVTVKGIMYSLNSQNKVISMELACSSQSLTVTDDKKELS